MTNQDVGSREGSWLEAVERAPGGVKGAARSLARALGTIRPVESEPAFKPALPFGELHIFQTMNKHRSVASMFGLRNPFYHAHEGRLGATTRSEGRELINYASYDYLGLNQEPAVAAAAKAAIDEFGTSVSASRLVAGERMMHREFEQEMADFYGSDACLAFVSGHATNISTIGVLMGPEDLIVQDELMHNSALVGGKLSRATSINFRHNNLDDLEKVLRENRAKHKNALILAEGLYSMDGDFPDLPRLIQLKKRYGCWLMMDEAHSLGVMGKNGRGSFEHFGVDPREVDIWMGTLSKTLGSCGGYICGSNDLIEILKYQAPGFVYSVGLSPPATAAALAALRILKSDPARIARSAGQRPLVRRGGEEGRPRHDDERRLLGRAGHGRRSGARGAPDGQARGAWHQCAADHSPGRAHEGGPHPFLHDLEAHSGADSPDGEDRCRRAGEHRQAPVADGAGDACRGCAMRGARLS